MFSDLVANKASACLVFVSKLTIRKFDNLVCFDP